MNKRAVCMGFILAALAALTASADAPSASGLAPPAPRLRGQLVASHTAVKPGESFHVAARLNIAEGWAFYSPNPFDKVVRVKVLPAELKVKEAGGLVVGRTLWPADTRHATDLIDVTQINHVYEGQAAVYVPLRVPAGAASGPRNITIQVKGQVCSGTKCDSADTGPLPVTVNIAADSAPNEAWTSDLAAGLKAAVPADVLPQLRGRAAAATRPAGIVSRPQGVADLTVWAGVGLALLAGLILNVMPCVLPVIPLRVLSLARMAGESRRRRIAMGLAFAGGIVLFFVAIAAVNVVFRLAWQRSFSVGGLFGFQGVRIAMALVLVALAANLFGLFTVVVPRRVAAMNRPAQGRGGCASSMAMGLMMAVLATPCSFAILAQAFAWSQLVSLWLGTIAIVLIGVGMAAPHAVLAAFPALLEKLPRPGRWMELFKQSMGFLLLPVAVWLIFAGPGDSYPAWVVAYAVVLAACLWVGGSWVRHDAPPARKGIVRAVAAALAVAAGIWMLTPPSPAAVPFEPFDLARIEQAGRDRRTVLIQFTSATCLSCYYLEKTVYNDPAVARALAGRQVLPVKGDVTDASGPAGKMLREQFTGAPPLTVILPPGGGKVVRLDGKFTKAKLIEALDEAAAGDKRQIRSTKPACRPAGSVP